MTLTEKQAAAQIGVSVHALRKWRASRRGPRFVKLRGKERTGRGNSGRVLYRDDDIRTFLDEMTIPTENPTPEEINHRTKKPVDQNLDVSENHFRAARSRPAEGIHEALPNERVPGGEDCRAATEALGLPYPFDWRASVSLAAHFARRGDMAHVPKVQRPAAQEVGGEDVSDQKA